MPLQHAVVCGVQRNDDDRVLRTLGFMNGDSIRQSQLVELSIGVFYLPALDVHRDFPVGYIDGRYKPDIAVENFLVIVIYHLDNLIALPESVVPANDGRANRVQCRLESLVEGAGTNGGGLLWSKDLYVRWGNRVYRRQPFLSQLHDLLGNMLGVVIPDEKEIRIFPILEFRAFTSVDTVAIGDDIAALSLPEDFR